MTTPRTLTREQLDEVLTKHQAWLRGAAGGTRAVLSGADLRSADLRSAVLSGADLRSAVLRSAYLQGADLRSADLQVADLQGADLRSADLQGADLRSADLQGADLRSAYLQGADLRSAYLQGADLRSAKFYPGWEVESYRDLLWIGPLGSRNDFLTVNLRQGYVVAGCFGVTSAKTIDDFVEAVKASHGESEFGREYLATVQYVKALMAARKPVETPSVAEVAI